MIHHFPLYWFSIPALHKGWIDRTLAYYIAYGGGKNFKGKKWLTCVTCGAKEAAFTKEGHFEHSVDYYLTHFNKSTPKLIKMDILPMHVVYGVNFANEEIKIKLK